MQIVTEEIAKEYAEPPASTLSQDNVEDIVQFYGSLLRTINTLYMSIIGGIDWADASEPLESVSPVMLFMFAAYIAFAVLCVLNIVTGVFVENANKFAKRNDEQALIDSLSDHNQFQEVSAIFKGADVNGDQEIDWDEFQVCLQDHRIQSYLKQNGLDIQTTSVNNVKGLFRLLDFDGGGTVDVDEFLLGISQLQSGNLDIARVTHDCRALGKDVQQLFYLCESAFTKMGVNSGSTVSSALPVRAYSGKENKSEYEKRSSEHEKKSQHENSQKKRMDSTREKPMAKKSTVYAEDTMDVPGILKDPSG